MRPVRPHVPDAFRRWHGRRSVMRIQRAAQRHGAEASMPTERTPRLLGGFSFSGRAAQYASHHPGLLHQLAARITCGRSDSPGVPRSYWRFLTPDSNRHPPDSGSWRHSHGHKDPTPPAPETRP